MIHQSSIELDYFLTKFDKPLLVTTYSLNGFFIEMVFDFYDRKFKSIQAYDSSESGKISPSTIVHEEFTKID